MHFHPFTLPADAALYHSINATRVECVRPQAIREADDRYRIGEVWMVRPLTPDQELLTLEPLEARSTVDDRPRERRVKR